MRTRRFRNEANDQRKGLRTRALLMDAAVTVFAKRSVETAPITLITSTAKVSHGTFYYHFKDKAELVDAVAHAIAAALVDQVDREIEGVTDGTERVALATQIFIKLAAAEREWGWLVVQAVIDMGHFRDQIMSGIRKDVKIGIEQGYFAVEPSDTIFTMLLSVVAVTLRQRLERPNDPDVESLGAAMILRMLGLPPNVADCLPLETWKKYISKKSKSGNSAVVPRIKIS